MVSFTVLVVIAIVLIAAYLYLKPTPAPTTGPGGAKRIALIGPGAVGSSYAYQLTRAGHDVTVIARTKRLAQLRAADNTITLTTSTAAAPQRVRVSEVHSELAVEVVYDLVLVCVLAHQLDDDLRDRLRRSAARKILFVYNTCERLQPLIDLVGGKQRFAFAFPVITAALKPAPSSNDPNDVRLEYAFVNAGPMVCPMTDPECAALFTAAGITCTLEPTLADMENWLRAHVALVVPFMSAAVQAHATGKGLTWRVAMQHALAMREALNVTQTLVGGERVPLRPRFVGWLRGWPLSVIAGLLWAGSRAEAMRVLGSTVGAEMRALIDAFERIAQTEGPITPADYATFRALRG